MNFNSKELLADAKYLTHVERLTLLDELNSAISAIASYTNTAILHNVVQLLRRVSRSPAFTLVADDIIYRYLLESPSAAEYQIITNTASTANMNIVNVYDIFNPSLASMLNYHLRTKQKVVVPVVDKRMDEIKIIYIADVVDRKAKKYCVISIKPDDIAKFLRLILEMGFIKYLPLGIKWDINLRTRPDTVSVHEVYTALNAAYDNFVKINRGLE